MLIGGVVLSFVVGVYAQEKKCNVRELLQKIRRDYWTEEFSLEEKYHNSSSFPTIHSCPAAKKNKVIHFMGDDGGGNMDIVSDERVAERLIRPIPITSNDDFESALCNKGSKQWNLCPASKLTGKPKALRLLAGDHFWYCNYKRYIARVECGSVDESDVISDPKYTYTRHVSGELKNDFKSSFTSVNTPWFDEIAVHFGVGGAATGHYLNQLPRLFELVALIPEHIPIAVRSNTMADQFADLFVKYGFVQPGRFRKFCTRKDVAKGRKPTQVCQAQKNSYFTGLRAGRLYYAAEAALHPDLSIIKHLAEGKNIHKDFNVTTPWFGMALEACSWQLSLPRHLLRTMMACALNTPHTHKNEYRVVVVDRRDAKSRMLTNHNKLMPILRATLPKNCTFFEFVGNYLTLEQQIQAFLTADLVIAPHGAALGFLGFMRPSTAIIEITYVNQGKSGPLIFFQAAQSVHLRYYLSVATSGRHSTGLTANIPDVVALAQRAIKEQYDETGGRTD